MLEARRRLAAGLVLAGEEAAEVAEFLGVHASSVRRWARAFGLGGDWALSAAPVPGRPPKLTSAQEARVLQWVGCDARAFSRPHAAPARVRAAARSRRAATR